MSTIINFFPAEVRHPPLPGECARTNPTPKAVNPAPTPAEANFGGTQANAVNARDLHAFLGIGKVFAAWMPDQIIRARLIENRDFVTCFPKSESESHGGQNRKEYLVTFDAAKQIGMMCGTDKGFEIRDYFIECEKKVLAPVQALDAFRVPQTLQEAMRVAADALDGTSPAGVRRHPCVRACPIRDSVEVWR